MRHPLTLDCFLFFLSLSLSLSLSLFVHSSRLSSAPATFDKRALWPKPILTEACARANNFFRTMTIVNGRLVMGDCAGLVSMVPLVDLIASRPATSRHWPSVTTVQLTDAPHLVKEYSDFIKSLGSIGAIQLHHAALAFRNAVGKLIVDERDRTVLALNNAGIANLYSVDPWKCGSFITIASHKLNNQ